MDDFESILADLMTGSQGSLASKTDIRRPDLNLLKEALRECFDSIRRRPAPLYERLAKLLRPGDKVITFNYDMAIERALRASGLWSVGSGYGFTIESDEPNTSVEVLKLHGSTNWRALLFEGKKRGGGIVHGNSLGYRPVLFYRADLEYLHYETFVDPQCRGLTSAATLPAIILPALPKRFYFETTFGTEWDGFWADLWKQASRATEAADELTIIGYSLPVADEAARGLLLNRRNASVKLSICCGETTPSIANEFRVRGFTNISTSPATFAEYLSFEEAKSGHEA